jgi:hypothetical protein
MAEESVWMASGSESGLWTEEVGDPEINGQKPVDTAILPMSSGQM